MQSPPQNEAAGPDSDRSSSAPLTVVLYDDRPGALTGLKLAVLSLIATSPGLRIEVITPGASKDFRDWAGARGVVVGSVPDGLLVSGWDVKPTVLLHALEGGAQQVLWFDTDIIATADIRPLLAPYSAQTLVATEEYYWGHHQGADVRTTRLGRPVGRTFARSINSGVLRVGPSHRSLLLEWARILASTEYRAAQDAPVSRRPVAFLGDQEVLGGLLGSREFADVPVAQLRRGVDIAQCFGPSGFTVKERWHRRHALPPLVHAMGRKPWSRPDPGAAGLRGRVRATWENAHLDLTPYVAVAREHLESLDEPTPWATPVTGIGRLLCAVVDSPALREVPLAAVDTTQRALRRATGLGQVPA